MKIMGDVIPTWVLIGAVVLAFCAGILNATALMGLAHISASHVTGNVSMLAVKFMQGDWAAFKLFTVSIISFWVGSVLSGMLIGSSELNIDRHYGFAMGLEALLLCFSLWMYLDERVFFGQMLIAMACGLQNSMVATYGGAVVRTTHLTGTTSDLGAAVGRWLVGRKMDMWRIILHSSLWWAFFIGGFLAVYLFTKIGYLSMLLPITIIATSAISYAWMGKIYNKMERITRLQVLRSRRKRRRLSQRNDG